MRQALPSPTQACAGRRDGSAGWSDVRDDKSSRRFDASFCVDGLCADVLVLRDFSYEFRSRPSNVCAIAFS